jgi:hypothetical protein
MIGLKLMRFDKDEEILGTLATSLIERREGICPTDEDFALYIEGRLDTYKRNAVISHLVSCRDCRERLTIPIPEFEVAEGPRSAVGFLSFLWRPIVLTPIAALFIALLSFTLNIYFKPQDATEERLRGANLVVLKQLDITPSLLTTLREGNEEEFKNELIKELPPEVRVSRVIVEDTERLKESKEGDKIILILYSDGSLKVKPGD